MGRRRRKEEYYLMKEIERIIDELNYSVDLVIVEGLHDERALRRYGYHGRIIKLSSARKPLKFFVEDIARKFRGCRVVLLLDFDSEGEAISKKIECELEQLGVKIDRHWREVLKELMTRFRMLTIEELTALRRRALE